MVTKRVPGQPASEAGHVRERRQALKPVGGKSSNSNGESAAFFGSFLGSKKERPRKLVGGKPCNSSGDKRRSLCYFL